MACVLERVLERVLVYVAFPSVLDCVLRPVRPSVVVTERKRWEVCTKVWSEDGEGPWLVIRDDGDLVYVDTDPSGDPATMKGYVDGVWGDKLSVQSIDVEPKYASMLTDVEPVKPEHWLTEIDPRVVRALMWIVLMAGLTLITFCVYMARAIGTSK